jgi:hypothetical protein
VAVEQQEVDETVGCLLEVVSKRIERGLGYLDVVFEDNISRAPVITDEPPACLLQKLVDLDPCCCLFLRAPPVTSLQLRRAYGALQLEVYHEHAKRLLRVSGVRVNR